MLARRATRRDVEDFFGQKRLAVVGVSRNESRSEYSRMVFRELVKRGYDAVPVNPNASEIEGLPCYARVTDVTPPVDGALVLLPSASAEKVVSDCAEAGVTRVWLRNDVPSAAELCAQRGITLVSGYCPFMFLPNGAFFHQCHGFGLKLVGRYPA
jgi:predicted CoA-binding protein